jgi:hypothetical protein
VTLISGELAQIRADFEAQILDQTCTIQTLTRTADGVGGFTESWANTYSSVACRLGTNMQASALGLVGDREVYPDAYTLNVANDQTIAEGNRVVAGGITYEVTHVKDTSVQWVFLRAAQLRRLDG